MYQFFFIYFLHIIEGCQNAGLRKRNYLAATHYFINYPMLVVVTAIMLTPSDKVWSALLSKS